MRKEEERDEKTSSKILWAVALRQSQHYAHAGQGERKIKRRREQYYYTLHYMISRGDTTCTEKKMKR